jgi:hypothetical protein
MSETHIVPQCLNLGDMWGLTVSVLLLPGAFMVFVASIFLQALPLMILGAFKHLGLTRPLVAIDRSATRTYVAVTLFVLLGLPAILLAVVWASFVVLVCTVLTLPVGIVCWRRTAASLSTLLVTMGRPGWRNRRSALKCTEEPYEEFPTVQGFGFVWSATDICFALLGGMDRQGYCEFAPHLACMVAFVPILKYAIFSNPFLYALDELYTNQWSQAVKIEGNSDNGNQVEMCAALSQQVCDTLLPVSARTDTDAWPFTGHHQHPPLGRLSDTVAGLQFTRWMTLISHTTVSRTLGVSTLPPRSPSASWTLLYVWLQLWNPWYQLAGYVEVNVRANGSVEHPMWLCADKRSRLHMLHVVNIDQLFVEVASHVISYVLA